VDLSAKYKSDDHSFTGTPEQKSAVTSVNFESPSNIEFLPKEIISDFPKLNGMIITSCTTLTIVRNAFFTKDFGAIEYLYLCNNKIETVEANAFQHLTKLKWIAMHDNQITSLPHQIFRNNPEIIAIFLSSNKINSITPDFSKSLNKLQYVGFGGNQCISKNFGCSSGSCSVTQAELDNGLSTCYTNCRVDIQCASKSEKLENLDREEVEKISKDSKDQQAIIESLGNNLTLLNQSNADNIKSLKKAVKKIEDLNRTVQEVQEESMKNAENYEKVKLELMESNEKAINLFKENTNKKLSAHLESAKDLNKVLSLQFSEAKALMENERLQCKLRETEYTKALELRDANNVNDKQAMDYEIKTLKQEIADMKNNLGKEIAELKAKMEENKKLADCAATLKQELSDVFKKEFNDFAKKIMENNQP
jgi:hypothetical protein